MLVKPDRPQLLGLREGLKDAGYALGQNLALEIPTVQSAEELRSQAKIYVRNKMDVIVTTGNIETGIAKESTRDIPIVFVPASNPIAAGFVKSHLRPGTNLTGIALIRDLDSYGKQLQVFKESVPFLSKLAVLYDARSNASAYLQGLGQLTKVAAGLAITLERRPVRHISEAEKAVMLLSRNTVDGIFVLCSSLFGSGPEVIISRAIERKLPLFSCGWSQQGALISFALDFYQIGRRGGWYVSQILKGAKPEGLPVEVPLNYEFEVNLRTATVIGLKIPAEILQRADKVIR